MVEYYIRNLCLHPLSGEYAKTTLPSLQKPDLEKFLFPFPLPFEQQKIVNVLSTIQTAQEKTNVIINALNELKKAMMKHLFMYGPVSLDEAKVVKLKKTEYGMIPNDWELEKLGNISEMIVPQRNEAPTQQAAGYPNSLKVQ